MSELSKERRAPYPENIGRYKIIGELGRGASSYVYKAFDPELERKLAIKLLRDSLGNSENEMESFLREGKLLAQLIHPGIVTIIDVGVLKDKPYIVMELMEGFTFEKIISTLGKVTLHTLIEMALQLSRALQYAHEKGIIHRDIKPANVLLLIDNKTVKLTDFGIAQLNKTFITSQQQADMVTGTPEYMSPEQVMGKSTDQRSDLYSLGVLIYHLVNGAPPFVNDEVGKIFYQITQTPVPLSPLESKIEEDLVRDEVIELIGKLLEKKPEDRFQTASEVIIKLQQISNKLIEKEPEPEAKKSTTKEDSDSMTTGMLITIIFTSILIASAIGFVLYQLSLTQ